MQKVLEARVGAERIEARPQQDTRVKSGDIVPNHITTSFFTANSLKSETPAACALALSTLSGARPDRPIA